MIKSFDDILAFRKEFAQLRKQVEGSPITYELLAGIAFLLSGIFLRYGLQEVQYRIPNVDDIDLLKGTFFIRPVRLVDELVLIALFNTSRENMNVVTIETF